MMKAYKAFGKDLKCRGKQYMTGGWNEEKKCMTANCGIHCATNPLDCLDYYRDKNNRRLFLVECGGDVDEDEFDSKVTCTKMRMLKELDVEALVYHACLYIYRHPRLPENVRIVHDRADLSEVPYDGFVIIRGAYPKARAAIGTVVGLVQEQDGEVVSVNLYLVDGKYFLPDRFYDVNGYEEKENLL